MKSTNFLPFRRYPRRLAVVAVAVALVTSLLVLGGLWLAPSGVSANPGDVAIRLGGLAAGREILVTGQRGAGTLNCNGSLSSELFVVVFGAGNQSLQQAFADTNPGPGKRLQIAGAGTQCAGSEFFKYPVVQVGPP